MFENNDWLIERLEMLRRLEGDRDNLPLLRAVQRKIARGLAAAERGIAFNRKRILDARKEMLEKNEKSLSEFAKLIINSCSSEIEKLKWASYMLRCMGDCLVFLYCASYDLRSAPRREESAGLMGSTAFGYASLFAFDALEAGEPAVPCTLTNLFRSGGVCLMGSGMPQLVEVRASSGRKGAAARRGESRERLDAYRIVGVAAAESSVPGEGGVPVRPAEVRHEGLLNGMIAQAKKEGIVTRAVEDGLWYQCCYGKTPDIASDFFRNKLFFYWNGQKTSMSWGWYRPFMLSIRDLGSLLDFLMGRLLVSVFVDKQVLMDRMFDLGFGVRFDFDGNAFVHKTNGNSRIEMEVPSLLLGRIGFDLVSLDWMLGEVGVRYALYSE